MDVCVPSVLPASAVGLFHRGFKAGAALFYRWLMMAGAALLAGCATASTMLSPTEMKTLKLESIEVKYAAPDSIWWGAAEREYLAKTNPAAAKAAAAPPSAELGTSKNATPEPKIADTPEAKAYIETKLSTMIRERVTRAVGADLNGSRPVKLVVNVHSFVIPSPAQRLLLGGTPMLAAVTTLQDARTGAELGKMDRIAAGMAGSGAIGVLIDQAFSDLEDRVLDTYASQVRAWLVTNRQAGT